MCSRFAKKSNRKKNISFINQCCIFCLPFLALKSIQKDKYLLNGGYVVGLGVREFAYSGARVWYSGSEKKLEEIRISGKTKENIKVEVSKWSL